MILGFDVGERTRGHFIGSETGDIIDRDRESSAGTGPVLLETLVRMIDRMTRNHNGELEGLASACRPRPPLRGHPLLPQSSRSRRVPLGTELAAERALT